MKRVLAVNGVRQQRARLPDEGFFEIEEALSETSFRYREGDVELYQDLDQVEVVVLHSWNESRFRIAELDTEARTISFLDPVLDPQTRTVKVRVNVANPDLRLKPGMFVRALLRARAIENQVYLVTSSYGMKSGVFDLEGNLIAEATDKEKVAVAEIDLNEQKLWSWLGELKNRIPREIPSSELIDY